MASIRWLSILTLAWALPPFASAEDVARLGEQTPIENDARQAVELYTKAIQSHPNDPAVYRGRAEAYQRLEQFDLSLNDLNVCLRLAPKDALALASRARLWLRTGHNREAIADATASLQLCANNAGAYGTRGLAYERSNDFARAVADYSESIRLHPTGLKYMLRGRCQEMLGNRNLAVADYNKGNSFQTVASDSRTNRPGN